MVPGHWPPYFGSEQNTKMNLSYLAHFRGIEENKLYHAIKCEADAELGLKQLKWSGLNA
jgi:hypothetical protein